MNIVHTIVLAALLGSILQSPSVESRTVRQIPSDDGSGVFDGASAYAYLVKQTQFGPRAPGTPGHSQCLKYLLNELRKYTVAVRSQEFQAAVPGGKNVQLTNLIASFNVESTDRMLLSAHWDTRLWADKDPDKKNWDKPIPGANDGASGVAIILEIARQLKKTPPPISVDLVLFDGEDLGTSGHAETFSLGAKYFSKNKPEGYAPRFGINIDMVGDRNLKIYREQNSERLAPQVQNLVFSRARNLNIPEFIDSPGEEVTDDHLPLNDAGIPTIDLIDFEYPDESNIYWHTLADTADKCSAESLAAVGRVLISIIYSQ